MTNRRFAFSVSITIVAAAVLASGCDRAEQKESDSMAPKPNLSAAASGQQPSLRDASAETLLLLLPDRAAYPEGWNVIASPSQDSPRTTRESEPPLPPCADPYRVLTRSGMLRALVFSKGYDARAYQELSPNRSDDLEDFVFAGKLSEIMITYLRESDGADAITAYRDWAEHCSQGNAGASGVHRSVTIIDGPDAKPDPAITIRITTDHPPLDPTGPETTTFLSITRVRGLAVISELQSGSDFSILAPVVQSALRKLRTV